MKQKYYRLDKLDKIGAPYNILLGERSNGKSYAVKERCISDAFKLGREFVYLRRYDLDIKTSLVESYFSDAPVSAITDGKYDGVVVYRGTIYLAKYDTKTQKYVKEQVIGYTMSLSGAEHYKSIALPNVYNVIFEEFVASNWYLPNEPLKLMNVISTILRRREGRVYMIGNTISRVCPYFSEWNLAPVRKMKPGEASVISYDTGSVDDDGEEIIIKIAVEFCENSGRNSKMFFGAGSEMITTGAWQTKEMPHLEGRVGYDYYCMYTIYMVHHGFMFKCDYLCRKSDGAGVWYVQPKTTPLKEPYGRIITSSHDRWGQLTTYGLKPLNAKEGQLFAELLGGNVRFTDNLTGADFQACIHELKNLSIETV